MAKWFQHEEHAAIEAAVEAWKNEVSHVPSATQRMVGRIEMALRSTDWRRVEAAKAEKERSA